MRDSDVLIEVHAVGLNFRDVLNVLDMYPGDPGPPGGDFSGVVKEVSASSRAGALMGVGDSVFGLAAGCLGTHTVTSMDAIAPVPGHLTHSDASTLPTVYVTVELALRWSVGSRSGERVLVHAATGGVGMAATSVLCALGGTPIGTAGSAAKRHQVRGGGVAGVFGSRDTCFSSEVCAVTGSLGVDVVLNSLTSPGFVGSSLSALGRGGRFVEIGKRDIWSVTRTQMERCDVSFGMVALDFAPPRVISGALVGVSSSMQRGLLEPLRITSWSLSETQQAMRVMAQARHMGKVVVRVPSSGVRQLGSASGVAVTGGFGALGVGISRWMAERGTGCVVVLGRSGRGSSSGLAWVVDGESCCGSLVVMQRCDVSSASEARSALGPVSGCGRMIDGVMHAGGVLRDAVLPNQTAGGVRDVFAPKVTGLSHIESSLNGSAPVRMLTLFSSISALLGSGGQSNYASANASLDARSESHVSCGIPSVSVQWGAWLGGGMADGALSARLERIGLGAIQPSEGLCALASLLVHADGASGSRVDLSPVVTVNPFRWERFLEQMPTIPPLYSAFADEVTRDRSVSGSSFADGTGPARAVVVMSLEQITSQLDEIVTSVVGHGVDVDEPLVDAGVDCAFDHRI